MYKIRYIVLLFILQSCQDDSAERQAYIDNQVQQKIQKHIKSKDNNCLTTLLENVSIDVDSVMLSQAALEKNKEIALPDKQRRPSRPTNKLPDFEKPSKPSKDSI